MKKILCLFLISLSGCASKSHVVSMGQDLHFVSRQATSLEPGTLKADALAEAAAHCLAQNKSVEILNVKEIQPPFTPENLPKAEVQFKCTLK